MAVEHYIMSNDNMETWPQSVRVGKSKVGMNLDWLLKGHQMINAFKLLEVEMFIFYHPVNSLHGLFIIESNVYTGM